MTAHCRYIGAVLLCIGSGLPLAAADDPKRADPPATTQPIATRPASLDPAEINRLLANLGVDDGRTRDAATERLVTIGPPALPALARLAKSDDPEVAARVQAIAARIDESQKNADVGPALRAAMNLIDQKGIPYATSAKVVEPGINELGVTHKSVKVVIRRDARGIRLSFTRQEGGAETTDRYDAADEPALSKEHPAAFAFYDKLVTQMGGDSRDLRQWFEHPAGE